MIFRFMLIPPLLYFVRFIIYFTNHFTTQTIHEYLFLQPKYPNFHDGPSRSVEPYTWSIFVWLKRHDQYLSHYGSFQCLFMHRFGFSQKIFGCYC